MPTKYPLTPGELASNCWPADPQILYNEMFSKGYLSLSLTGVLIQANEPVSTDRDKVWIKLDGNMIQPFIYLGGGWKWRYPIPPGDNNRMIWTGSLANLKTYDGGNTNAVGPANGPFWEEDTQFQGFIPVGVGTIQPSGTAVAVTQTLGSDQLIMQPDQLAKHKHAIPIDGEGDPTDGLTGTLRTASTNIDWYATVTANHLGYTRFTGEDLDQPDPLDITPPVIGVYLVKRTARIFITP